MEQFHTKIIQQIMKLKIVQVIEEKTILKSEKSSTTLTPLSKQYVNAN